MRAMHMSGGEGRRLKQITIRGVDEALYRQVSRLARRLGVNVGTLINKSMELLLSRLPGESVPKVGRLALDVPVEFTVGLLEGVGSVVEDVEELSVSRRDLEQVDGGVAFVSVRKLEFEDDVDPEIFREKVRAILSCGEIVIPRDLPKLLVLSVSRGVGRVVVREGGA